MSVSNTVEVVDSGTVWVSCNEGTVGSSWWEVPKVMSCDEGFVGIFCGGGPGVKISPDGVLLVVSLIRFGCCGEELSSSDSDVDCCRLTLLQESFDCLNL